MSDRGMFGEWLDTTLENQDISGKDFAVLLSVTPGAVSRWRNGQAVPSTSTLSDIGDLLGVDKLRLLATAGVKGVKDSGIEPLDLPPRAVRRDRARAEIKKIKSLDRMERQKLIEAYDRIVRERTEKSPGSEEDTQ
jgi:transcriptional regulator with XRE-family HTH domain